mgnify:CR=1 FL=1
MLLDVRHLRKEYKRGENVFRAVNDVDLAVDAGDFVCITGRSGSGKSTLLNMIAGLLEPTSGSILFDGAELLHRSDEEMSLFRNTRIGYIPQGPSAVANLSVLENVMLPFCLRKRTGNASAKAFALLEQLGVGHLAQMYPARLSEGELRRMTIARSLINTPALLIADEPTGDLDDENTSEVLEIFTRISRNNTAVLLVTHESDVVRYGNRRFNMNAGILSDDSNST